MNLINDIRIKLGIIFVLGVIVISLLLAPNASPASPLFNLKRAQEKVYLNFKSTPLQKADFLLLTLDRRLNELEQIVASKRYNYMLHTSLRYSTTAGEITKLALEIKDKDLLDRTRAKFRAHQQRLKILNENYPKDTNVEGKYIIDDYNYLTIYLDQLK